VNRGSIEGKVKMGPFWCMLRRVKWFEKQRDDEERDSSLEIRYEKGMKSE